MPPNTTAVTMVKQQKYLHGENDTEPVPQHIAWVLQFCDALERRVKTDLAIEKHPLREVGYSTNVQRRLREHIAHHNSNFLMNLADTICGIEFPGQFHFSQFIVALQYAPEQGATAEILLTCLASGRSSDVSTRTQHTGNLLEYIESGMGLQLPPASQYNPRTWKFSAGDYGCFVYAAVEHSPLMHNMDWDTKRLQEYREALEKRKMNNTE